MIQAVLFDMDGLLIDSEPIWREAEKEIFSLVNINLSDEMCFQTVGLRIDEVVNYWHEQFPWDNYSKVTIKELIIARVIELITQKGNALPGVYEVLNFFKQKHIPMAIASASSLSIIKTVVTKLAIEDYLNFVHSAEEEEYGKPNPAVYLSAAQKLKISPHHCLVFEDSFNGVIAAKAARMKVIAVPEDIHRGELKFHAADLQLFSLLEFNENIWEKMKEA